MSASYETERQNDASLASLSNKVSALRSVTVNIYDQARSQDVIDNTSDTFSSMTGSLKGSARRLGTMARQGDRVAVMKVAGILVVMGVLLYWILGWIFG